MDPYVEACASLEEQGIRYLIVGAFGINLYAGQVGLVITTADCDILLAPGVAGLSAAVRTLRLLGYAIEAGDEPLPDEDPVVLAGIMRARACVRGSRADARIDLPLELTGATFESLWAGQRRFVVEGVTLRVAPLAGLLRSKELAGRPKDVAFLAAHRAALDELLRREERETGARPAPPPKKRPARKRRRRS